MFLIILTLRRALRSFQRAKKPKRDIEGSYRRVEGSNYGLLINPQSHFHSYTSSLSMAFTSCSGLTLLLLLPLPFPLQHLEKAWTCQCWGR